MPAVKDYTIEIGWNAQKVNAGIDALQKRIRTLSQLATNLDKTTKSPSPSKGAATGANAKKDFNRENQKLVDQYTKKIRQLEKQLMSLNTSGEKGRSSKRSIENQIEKLNKAQADLKGNVAKSNEALAKQQHHLEKLNRTAEGVQHRVALKQMELKQDQKAAKLAASEDQVLRSRTTALREQAETIKQRLINQNRNLDMQAKGARANRRQLREQIVALKNFQKQVADGSVTSRKQLEDLRVSFGGLRKSVLKTSGAVHRANKQFSLLTKTARRAANSFISAAAAAMGAYAVLGATKAIYDNGKAWENLEINMQAAFGSAEEGQNQMAFLKGQAMKLGVDVQTLASGYSKLGTAARMSGVPLEQSQELFLAAAEASRAFGLSNDDTQGVMRAFAQMMGKGQVMMEELKLQLGDRMPSAIGIFAKSMGLSVMEFREVVESGQVGTKELINFGRALRQDVKDSGAYQRSLTSLEAAQGRFNTALKLAGDMFFKGKLRESFVDLFGLGRDTFEGLSDFLFMIGDILGTILKKGIFFLGFVLRPIIAAFNGIGKMYKWFADTSLMNDEDLDKAEWYHRLVVAIGRSWREVGYDFQWFAIQVENFFKGKTRAFDDLFDKWRALFGEKGIQVTEDQAKTNAAKQAIEVAKARLQFGSAGVSPEMQKAFLKAKTGGNKQRMQELAEAQAAMTQFKNEGATSIGNIYFEQKAGESDEAAKIRFDKMLEGHIKLPAGSVRGNR